MLNEKPDGPVIWQSPDTAQAPNWTANDNVATSPLVTIAGETWNEAMVGRDTRLMLTFCA